VISGKGYADVGGTIYNPNDHWSVDRIVLAAGPPGWTTGLSLGQQAERAKQVDVRRYSVDVQIPPLASRSFGVRTDLSPGNTYEWALLEASGK